uniref:Uncharacterized protein n=1 Tax=viral metagenome TaxID=1070528 RepID=A0A6M3LA52_9ZZZZ
MATIVQLVKDLIGKEDINFGDSSTTFSRSTQTGGTINMSYIDAEIIPSTGLGSYIGTWLHKQNTDSLTTATTFGINSTGNSVVLNGTGLSAARTFTFPDTSNQVLAGETDLANTTAGTGAAMIGVEAASLTNYTSTTLQAVLEEIDTDTTTTEAALYDRGFKSGFKLGYSSTTQVTISGGMWAHIGTTNRHVYTNAELTFTLGPGGSNGGSTALGANEVHYIYIDDSAVVAAASSLLTVSEFINLTTAPAYAHAKAGWYNNSDRCIGAVLTNASNEVLSFVVLGNNFYRYATPVLEYTTAAGATSYTSLDLSSSVPSFCTRAHLRIMANTAGVSINFDTSSTAVSPESHTLAIAQLNNMIDVPLTSAQTTFWYGTPAANYELKTTGYYIDEL